MRHNDALILVMARAPVAGKAKTRLIPSLGEAGAAHLHAWMVERLLLELAQAAVAPVTLCCTPSPEHPFFASCQERYGVSLATQQGDNLGERLAHALQRGLSRYHYAVVVGCDIPLLRAQQIDTALSSLKQGMDAVIIPTEDGGYALMAVKRVEMALFSGIHWGGEEVMAQTRQRLTRLGWCWRELPMLWDVDRPEDLQRLHRSELPPQLSLLLAQLDQGCDHERID